VKTLVETVVQTTPQAESGSCGFRMCGVSAPVSTTDLQMEWAARSVSDRLLVLRGARHRMAERTEAFASAISPHLARTTADTLVTELLPLLDACKFLERNAESLLKPRKLGLSGRPLWLGGVSAEIHREPLGHVLVIGPSNFPLFLPGVQVLQALVAGNAVTWKPGVGGAAVAELVKQALRESGLPGGVLAITDESVEAAQHMLADGADKVIFTGSSRSGRAVLTTLAATTTPAVVELSGADAVVVTPAADLKLVARAIAFGLRLNGGAVCMSPRRLFATGSTLRALRPLLEAELASVPAVKLEPRVAEQMRAMLDEAHSAGAELIGVFEPVAQKPLLVNRAAPGMAIAHSDVFAPVVSLIEAESMMHIPDMYAQCPYALSVAVFCGKGETARARALSRTLKAGTVLINDLIAPTADPRIPFGGRGASGYGVTRGAEGLLEMTAVKTLIVRNGGSMRHLDATTDADAPMFANMIGAMHRKGFAARWSSLMALMKSSRRQK
jgi:acyl-CoA reductase-like NAD-dependent aldehyde dehydrogenase